MLAEDVLNGLARAGLVAVASGRVRFAVDWLARYCAGEPTSANDGPVPVGRWGHKVAVGLTGNIATGKSTVLGMLRELGGRVIDADRLVHQLREPGAPGYQPLLDVMGPSVLLPDGRVDRQALAGRAFADPALLRQLELIFRPLVIAEVERLGQSATERVVIVEAIKLLEGGLSEAMDLIWVVDAPRDQQIARLTADRGLSRQEAEVRVDAQNPQREKLARADTVITNAGDLDATLRQVLTGWFEILRRLYVAGWLEVDLVAGYLQQASVQAGSALEGARALRALQALAVNRPAEGLAYRDALARLDD